MMWHFPQLEHEVNESLLILAFARKWGYLQPGMTRRALKEEQSSQVSTVGIDIFGIILEEQLSTVAGVCE